VPTTPLARVGVVMLGKGETTTAVDADFVVSAIEVACTATVMLAETDVGAL
jgi:hypothetical protein